MARGLRGWVCGTVALVLLAVLAQAESAVPRAMRELPAEWRLRVAQAESAFRTLQQRLQQRLTAEIAAKGPAGAVEVCKQEAAALARSVASEQKIALGRTSDRLRNPDNAPRPWAYQYVVEMAGKPANEVEPVWFDLGDSIGVLHPIPTGGVCLTCHGERRGFPAELQAALERLYPTDRAVGFRSGELRGFFWAELEKPGAASNAAGVPEPDAGGEPARTGRERSQQ